MSTNDRNASEKAIEDVLAKFPGITESTIDYPQGSLTYLARQQSVEVGRTDLLFLAGDELVLIELKAEAATQDHVEQLESYREHYRDSVLGDRYPAVSTLTAILLAPRVSQTISDACDARDLIAIEFDVGEVFQQFRDQLFTGHSMFEKQPISTGVASLHFINGLIGYLGDEEEPRTKIDCISNLDRIAKRPNWSHPEDRMGQFIRLGIRLNLIQRVGKAPLSQIDQLRLYKKDKLILTERGQRYYNALPTGPEDVPPLSVQQADILIDLLYERPFYSNVTTGIVVFLDTIYDLSRASNRVPSEALEEWYPRKAGKDWTGRSPRSMVNWYGNYTDELGLISKVKADDGPGTDDYHYLTPEGAKMLSYLQVEIGKEMIRAQG